MVKIPKWQFEKFPGADETLGPQMKSVGEVMAIGRTFKEAMMKAVRSLETGKKATADDIEPRRLTQRLVTPHPERLAYVRYAFERGMTVREVARVTTMDPWFLHQMKQITDEIKAIGGVSFDEVTADQLRTAKRMGISDERLAAGWGLTGAEGTAKVRALRRSSTSNRSTSWSIPAPPSSKASRPISTAATTKKMKPLRPQKKKIIILGSGPNRIGRGIEFDYCCCHAAFALREDGYETIMVNCNPETVSTDY